MHQIQNIIKLRLLQASRNLQSVGLGLFLVFLVVASGMILTALSSIVQMPAIGSIGAVLIGLWSIDYFRKDHFFLERVFQQRKQIQQLVFLEYLLLSLPIILFQLYQNNFEVAGLLFLPPILVSFFSGKVKYRKDNFHKKSFAFIPLAIFEFKFHIEKNRLAYLFFYIMGCFSFFHVAFFAGSMIGISILALSAFETTEPREMIHFKSNFVWKKVLLNLKHVLLVISPLVKLALIFNLNSIGLIIYSFLFMVISIFMVISYKYARYTPMYPMPMSSNTLAIVIVLSLFPGGILVSFAFGLFYYFKAERNMKYLFQ